VTPELSLLLLATVAVIIYFGPTVVRLVLKPEKGSETDLRIAWWETFLNDFEKRHKVGEKLKELTKKQLGLEAKQDESVARKEQEIREELAKEAAALGAGKGDSTPQKESTPP